MPRAVLDILEGQIEEARDDLHNYRPHGINWPARAKTACRTMIPWLVQSAPGLRAYVEDVLNAPVELRRIWMTIRPRLKLPIKDVEAFDRQLALDDVLRESVTGEVVSKVVTKYLIEHNPSLECNGRSDYPDLYLGTLDYSNLPTFRRRRAREDEEYGAALKGTNRRPVRVPDGLEIKTCRRQVRVDCHHPHAGLHLVLVFDEAGRLFRVADLCVAFLRSADYHEAAVNTTATTVKYSFNGERFVSLL